MEYITVVEVNGRLISYITESDDEVDAQNSVISDINKSIKIKSCGALNKDEELSALEIGLKS